MVLLVPFDKKCICGKSFSERSTTLMEFKPTPDFRISGIAGQTSDGF